MTARRRAGLAGTGAAAGIAGWLADGELGRLPGLAASVAVAEFTVPVLIVAAWFGPGLLAGACIPREWRAGHRYRHGRQFCRSARITARIKRAVLAADRYRCVACGLAGDLQIDHVMPWSCGGLSSLFNLMVLCGGCNRVKSNYWRWRDGRVTYRGVEGRADERRAAVILAAERRARWNPLRWWRAAIAL